ncbi:unnamed protein product [Effrenium voratum]|uniref:Uncharacterized protein n=1 Tax=Effrenium voratum TaxID=2562239 RepID=A0AA36IH73_9DINO|nr:unnamed protein product [Effrenium voratum]CAJ1450578.1 unnamed protein product [Effrenium voratum]
MSASKLEKSINNLEKRLKEEFHQELKREITKSTAQMSARLTLLERRLNLNQVEITEDDWERDEATVSVNRLVVCQDINAAKHVPVLPAPAKGEAWEDEVSEGQSESDNVDEPVAFLETAWNLVLVLGRTSASWSDILVSCILLVASAAMQVVFSVILLQEDFLGEPFASQIDIATSWRRNVAHDYKHMDLAHVSLASRVCNGDGKLILSNVQAALLSQINSFLGMGRSQFDPPWLQPGILLCILCILLWALYLCNELRAVCFSLEAVSYLPRGRRTIVDGGRFLQMSYVRYMAYCLMRLARLGIAVVLLYAGVLWLAGTTSITDLILNAVALSAILEVDEMVFAALMPKKVQISIQDLEAIKVKYSKFRSSVESMFLLLIIIAILAWAYIFQVAPLGRDMLEVKKQKTRALNISVLQFPDAASHPANLYCGGHQDFVVQVNNNLQVSNWTWSPEGAVSNYIQFEIDGASLDTSIANEWEEVASVDNHCLDWDGVYLRNEADDYQELQDILRTRWFSTSLSLGMSPDSNCSEMSAYCEDSGKRLLKNMCARTCGCDSPYSDAWFRVPRHGCPNGCTSKLREDMQKRPCQDLDMTSPGFAHAWTSFWKTYLVVLAFLYRTEAPQWVQERVQNMTSEGCRGLRGNSQDPIVLQYDYCAGSADFRGLAWLCPESCGCEVIDPAPEWCPRTCQGCADAEDWPVQNIPGIGLIADCLDARGYGLCQAMPVEALAYCAKTCGLCHLLNNTNSTNSTRRLAGKP